VNGFLNGLQGEWKMQKQSFARRWVTPTATVFLTMVVTGLIYQFAWRIPHEGTSRAVSAIIAVPFFLSIGFGVLIVYPMAFFRGATVAERITASLFTPVAWILKEIFRVTAFFSIGESIYFGLHQLFLLTLVGALAQMGLCELICRWRLKKAGEEVRVFSGTPVSAIILGMAGIYVLFIWGWGTNFFYFYMEIYKTLFQ
jgi:hypothetical protein